MFQSQLFIIFLVTTAMWLSTPRFCAVSAFTLCMRKGGNVPTSKFTKSNLPSKICVVCNRPFEYRKKWEKVWADVKYCSDRCRGNKQQQQTNGEDLPMLPRQ